MTPGQRKSHPWLLVLLCGAATSLAGRQRSFAFGFGVWADDFWFWKLNKQFFHHLHYVLCYTNDSVSLSSLFFSLSIEMCFEILKPSFIAFALRRSCASGSWPPGTARRKRRSHVAQAFGRETQRPLEQTTISFFF